jgi:phosphoglucosamine mutase
MARQLFGTDGIRGVAGEAPLDRDTVFAFGIALGEWASAHAAGGAPRVVIGADTRESGPWLAATAAAGLKHAGVETAFAGLTTTPGVAHLAKTEDFVAGLMISASHNPYRDNGLKAFDHSGFKLPDQTEHALEARIFELLAPGVQSAELPLTQDESLDRHYIEALAATVHDSFQGRRIVLDCANGAASKIGPELFHLLGADVVATGCSPDGRNINENCGALHVDQLRERVLAEGAEFGAAFDGDADRCILVGRTGKVIDGDHCMLIAGRALHAAGRLKGSVVATVMSNLGLERALRRDAIALRRTSVGDRYVLEEMVKHDLPLGGEQSGHVIFREHATTGDGLLTALRVLETAIHAGASLEDLTSDFTIYPQRLVNVRFRTKRPLEELPSVQAEIRATEEHFGDAGRVLVRFSGTEPLARVMVEGPDLSQVEARAQQIARAIAEAMS